jgi:hypothetical protein
MESSLTPEELQSKVREEISKKFSDLLAEAKNHRGQLSQLANQIGVRHQMLDNYAKGSMPGADVLLTAFLKWNWVIEIKNPGGTPAWCKFSMAEVEGEAKKLKQPAVQLSLFDALYELEDNLELLKKSVAKAGVELQKSLKRA